jgi:D-sedoheptulose 7-phosphate isomerase
LKEYILNHLNGHTRVFQELKNYTDQIMELSSLIVKCFENGGSLYFCGNGGSAADAQHLAAEFVGRYTKNRKALRSVSLSTDTSVITCVANDYSYGEIFSRQIEALASDEDLLFVISTSGNSKNINNAIKQAKFQNVTTIGLLGKDGGHAKQILDYNITVPSDITAHIQEAHITIGHMIVGIVEIEMGLV